MILPSSLLNPLLKYLRMKGKACVQWIFSLDTLDLGHVSKFRRVQWKNSLDRSLLPNECICLFLELYNFLIHALVVRLAPTLRSKFLKTYNNYLMHSSQNIRIYIVDIYRVRLPLLLKILQFSFIFSRMNYMQVIKNFNDKK